MPRQMRPKLVLAHKPMIAMVQIDSCVVNVRATDASGAATAAEAGTNIFVDAEVTIKITDVNEKPTVQLPILSCLQVHRRQSRATRAS